MLSRMSELIVATSEGVELRQDIAGVGSRVAAGLLDALILLGFFAVLLLTVLLVYSFDPSGMSGFILGLLVGGNLLLLVAYDIVFHALWQGQTPGKRVLGIRVMSADGYPPTLLQLVLRGLVFPIDVFLSVPIPIGVIVIAATPKHQRLGDLVAGTLLVRVSQPVPIGGRVEPWPREQWSNMAVHTFALAPGLAARLSSEDRAFLREILTRTELSTEERRKLFVDAARHYAELLGLGPFEDARVVLKEVYLFAREMKTRA